MQKITYYLFGFIPLLSVKKSMDLDTVYEAMAARFSKEMDLHIAKLRGGQR